MIRRPLAISRRSIDDKCRRLAGQSGFDATASGARVEVWSGSATSLGLPTLRILGRIPAQAMGEDRVLDNGHAGGLFQHVPLPLTDWVASPTQLWRDDDEKSKESNDTTRAGTRSGRNDPHDLDDLVLISGLISGCEPDIKP
ncbi:MAG: hypothetical protein Q9216_005399 [Gyalolechia sp. 2 TL-2023]